MSTEIIYQPTHFSHLLPEQEAHVDTSPFNVEIPEDSERKYLNFQRMFVEKLKQQAREKSMSKVKTNAGMYTTGKKRIYMFILLYIAKRPHIYDADGTTLMDLIKEMSSINGFEIPLPSR
jgi:hypothetical protein